MFGCARFLDAVHKRVDFSQAAGGDLNAPD